MEQDLSQHYENKCSGILNAIFFEKINYFVLSKHINIKWHSTLNDYVLYVTSGVKKINETSVLELFWKPFEKVQFL